MRGQFSLTFLNKCRTYSVVTRASSPADFSVASLMGQDPSSITGALMPASFKKSPTGMANHLKRVDKKRDRYINKKPRVLNSQRQRTYGLVKASAAGNDKCPNAYIHSSEMNFALQSKKTMNRHAI